MTHKNILLVGAPVDCGRNSRGCLMGPDAFRTAGLVEALTELGHTVTDTGNVAPADPGPVSHPNPALHKLSETIGWTQALMETAMTTAPSGMPIFLGGDHALAAGTVAGMAAHAATIDRPLFVLWLDAHSDFHTLNTTTSGNIHGTPVGYITGRDGFDPFPALPAAVPTENICMIGLRSVDPEERVALNQTQMQLVDMRAIDEQGIARPLATFLNKVRAANGLLHVSLDVDFLEPDIAPAVGTTVPGGATVREAHLVMEMLHDAGCVASLDLVELNPFLDERGRTASLMVDLTASLLGRRIFDRPTRRFA